MTDTKLDELNRRYKAGEIDAWALSGGDLI